MNGIQWSFFFGSIGFSFLLPKQNTKTYHIWCVCVFFLYIFKFLNWLRYANALNWIYIPLHHNMCINNKREACKKKKKKKNQNAPQQIILYQNYPISHCVFTQNFFDVAKWCILRVRVLHFCFGSCVMDFQMKLWFFDDCGFEFYKNKKKTSFFFSKKGRPDIKYWTSAVYTK